MRDSRGEELLSVTMRRDTVTPADTVRLREFIISMDALERFASHEVPDRCLAKTFDWRRLIASSVSRSSRRSSTRGEV